MPAIAIWIWFCAYLNCAGWALSAVHQLNAGGYAVALLVWLAALFVWRKHSAAHIPAAPPVAQVPPPFSPAVSAGIFDSGGAGLCSAAPVYAPTNYDALAYRVPRDFALAGGGPVAMDPLHLPAPQQPLLRHRMGFRAVDCAVQDRPAGCS